MNVEETSERGSIPTARRMRFASSFSTQMTGFSRREMSTRGGPKASAARSGAEIARFFGIISPATT